MSDEQKITGKMEVAGITGPLWAAAWLFTVGYAQLSFGKGFLALVLWPYYLGQLLRGAGAG
ncbi:hypothetical protein GF314_13230 [bacterium]|nr:hypothetical protein [bacterium]